MKKEIRNQQIVRLRNKGLTYEKIGEIFNISRQRAYQIYNQNKNAIRREKNQERL